jgi:hypothetical protein
MLSRSPTGVSKKIQSWNVLLLKGWLNGKNEKGFHTIK